MFQGRGRATIWAVLAMLAAAGVMVSALSLTEPAGGPAPGAMTGPAGPSGVEADGMAHDPLWSRETFGGGDGAGLEVGPGEAVNLTGAQLAYNGTIEVGSGGNLLLVNCTLALNATEDQEGPSTLVVRTGGCVHAVNTSFSSTGEAGFSILLEAGSASNWTGCRFTGLAGGPPGSPGYDRAVSVSSDSASFSQCAFEGSARTGVSIDTASPSLAGCVVEGFDTGLSITGGSEPLIEGTEVTGSSETAVQCSDSSPVLRECVLSGGGDGVRLACSPAVIDSTIIAENSGRGVFAEGAEGFEISSGEICHNSQGIYLYGARDALLNGTIVDSNTCEGLDVHKSEDMVFRGVTVSGNGQGVYLQGSVCEFTSCRFDSNTGDGVLTRLSRGNFTDCTFTTNGGWGIRSEGSTIALQGNTYGSSGAKANGLGCVCEKWYVDLVVDGCGKSGADIEVMVLDSSGGHRYTGDMGPTGRLNDLLLPCRTITPDGDVSQSPYCAIFYDGDWGFAEAEFDPTTTTEVIVELDRTAPYLDGPRLIRAGSYGDGECVELSGDPLEGEAVEVVAAVHAPEDSPHPVTVARATLTVDGVQEDSISYAGGGGSGDGPVVQPGDTAHIVLGWTPQSSGTALVEVEVLLLRTLDADGYGCFLQSYADSNGASYHEEHTITITGSAEPRVNDRPTADASFTPSQGTVGTRFRFSAEAQDAQGGLTYLWDFGDGATGIGEVAFHTFADDLEYEVTLVVLDSQNVSSPPAVETVRVANTPPTAVISLEDGRLWPGEKVTLSAAGSTDPDDAGLTFVWDLGDGSEDTGPEVDHYYGSTGTYTITLTAVDDDGDEGTATLDISIEYDDAVLNAADGDGEALEGAGDDEGGDGGQGGSSGLMGDITTPGSPMCLGVTGLMAVIGAAAVCGAVIAVRRRREEAFWNDESWKKDKGASKVNYNTQAGAKSTGQVKGLDGVASLARPPIGANYRFWSEEEEVKRTRTAKPGSQGNDPRGQWTKALDPKMSADPASGPALAAVPVIKVTPGALPAPAPAPAPAPSPSTPDPAPAQAGASPPPTQSPVPAPALAPEIPAGTEGGPERGGGATTRDEGGQKQPQGDGGDKRLDPRKVQRDRRKALELLVEGCAHKERGDGEAALLSFYKAKECDPENPDVWLEMSMAFNRLGDPERSMKCYHNSIRLARKARGAQDGLVVVNPADPGSDGAGPSGPSSSISAIPAEEPEGSPVGVHGDAGLRSFPKAEGVSGSPRVPGGQGEAAAAGRPRLKIVGAQHVGKPPDPGAGGGSGTQGAGTGSLKAGVARNPRSAGSGAAPSPGVGAAGAKARSARAVGGPAENKVLRDAR